MVSFDCLNPIETTVIDPDRWWTSVIRSFRSGFFLSGMNWKDASPWLRFPPEWEIVPIQLVGVLQMLIASYYIATLVPGLYDRWVRQPVPRPIHRSRILFWEFAPLLQHIWQWWLGVLFVSVPWTGMSGLSMGAVFFHSMAETTLFVLRLMALRNAVIIHVHKWVAVVMILTILEVLTDNPVVKAIITMIPAGISDIGNVIICLWFVCKESWKEGAQHALARGPDEGLMSTPPRHMFYISHAWFACLHILVFYPHLFVVCTPGNNAAALLTYSASLNLVWYIPYGNIRPLVPSSDTPKKATSLSFDSSSASSSDSSYNVSNDSLNDSSNISLSTLSDKLQ